jgi:CRP/FNR family cyclic AMP-dependent transcriptional regulator
MSIPTTDNFNRLGLIALFRGLTRAELGQLSEVLQSRIFPAGKMIVTAGQQGEAVYFILSGTVKVYVEQEDGREVIISILGPGECFGEMSPLDQSGRSPNVVTVEGSELLWLDCTTFRRLLLTGQTLAFNLACVLSMRLQLANEQIRALATLEAENRIARQILAFSEKYGKVLPNGDLHIPIRLTQSDIAALAGASREHTNKILVSYRERGYLSADRRHYITVHNPQALARRCSRAGERKPTVQRFGGLANVFSS